MSTITKGESDRNDSRGNDRFAVSHEEAQRPGAGGRKGRPYGTRSTSRNFPPPHQPERLVPRGARTRGGRRKGPPLRNEGNDERRNQALVAAWTRAAGLVFGPSSRI